MSCNCKQEKNGEKFSCECDRFEHPQELSIDAGMPYLNRQIATFTEFRTAMLYDLNQSDTLRYWLAKKDNDSGLMLLEMWAYICDSIAFYNKVIAQEEYIRTAQQRAALRKLVALLSYLPRPAVGATVRLAVMAEGRQIVKLPKGTAFRSGAFEGSPPQVFELNEDTPVHPLANKWNILPPNSGVIEKTKNSFLLIVNPKTEIKPDSLLLLINKKDSTQNKVLLVKQADPYTGKDGVNYTKIIFYFDVQLVKGTPLSDLQLLFPVQSAAISSIMDPPHLGPLFRRESSITLTALHSDLRPGQYILVKDGSQTFWQTIEQVAESMQAVKNNTVVKINNNTFAVPDISVRVTRLIWQSGTGKSFGIKALKKKSATPSGGAFLYFDMQTAGTLANESKTTLINSDNPLLFSGTVERPAEPYQPTEFLISDKNLFAEALSGVVNYNNKYLNHNSNPDWQDELTLPASVFGNIVSANRGETVRGEVLGSGDASLPGQTFKLKKKPLTYLLTETFSKELVIGNTLEVYVNGIRWKEVSSFFGKKPFDQVYIIRQDDQSDSFITFGDGIRGQRLPSGTGNVMANYRFGAGKISPPANVVNQISKPVKGLQSVNNPLAAIGGDDAENADDIKINASRSALILGRAVSIQDMEAAALTTPGVQSVQAEWRWDENEQRPVVQLWYIGDAGMETAVSRYLRSVCDPSTPITVNRSLPVQVSLHILVKIDPRFIPGNISAAIQQVLTNEKYGLLIPHMLGTGRPLFRSKIFESILEVEGTLSVQSISWDTTFFDQFAKTPGQGKYFDFLQTGIQINITQ